MDIKEVEEYIYNELKSVDEEEKKLEEARRTEWIIAQYKGDDEIIHSDEAREIVALQKSNNEFRATTGMPKLDETIEGFRLGNLVIVSAPTGAGKTTLCQTFTENFHQRDIACLWFSYEVPMAEFLEKIGDTTEFCLPKQLSGNTMEWIEKKVIEAKIKYNARVVFIDHLHYVVNMSAMGRGNTSLIIGETMRELKKLAVKLNVIIFLVAHLTKTRFDEMPDISDLRDSSFIAQEADIVMIMKRNMEKDEKGYMCFTNNATLTVQKHRRTGKTCTLTLIHDNQKFHELTRTGDRELLPE